MPRLSMVGPFGGRIEYSWDFELSISELRSCGSISDIITCPFRPGCSLDNKCGKCGCDAFPTDVEEHSNPPLGLLCLTNEMCRGKKAIITIEKPDGRIYTLEHDCGAWYAPNLLMQSHPRSQWYHLNLLYHTDHLDVRNERTVHNPQLFCLIWYIRIL
jgi:hypothetical protein